MRVEPGRARLEDLRELFDEHEDPLGEGLGRRGGALRDEALEDGAPELLGHERVEAQLEARRIEPERRYDGHRARRWDTLRPRKSTERRIDVQTSRRLNVRASRRSRLRRGPSEALALEHLDEGRAVEPEELGRAVLVAAGAVKRLADHVVLVLLHGQAQVDAGVGQRAQVAPRLLRGAAQLRGQVVGANDGPLAEQHGALDGVLERADVAWPIVGLEHRHRLIGEADEVLTLHAFGARVQEEAREHLDVFDALSQGRQVHVHHVEAVIEVLAEASGGHLGLEVAVGGRDDADVTTDRPGVSHR